MKDSKMDRRNGNPFNGGNQPGLLLNRLEKIGNIFSYSSRHRFYCGGQVLFHTMLKKESHRKKYVIKRVSFCKTWNHPHRPMSEMCC